jgi:D-alanine-D-alanine ligase
LLKEENVDRIANVLKKLQKPTKIAILLVVNMQDTIVDNDYDKFSVVTTYYSERELNEIVNGFKTFAYVDVSYGEKEFINKLNNGFYDELHEFQKIVFTETAGGITRSKSALIPAICDAYKFKYCSNDVFTSALLDNKMATSAILKFYGYLLPDTWIYHYKLGWMSEQPINNILLIAKPAYECASIGITEESISIMDKEYLDFIHILSQRLNQPILIQELIEGHEVEVPILDFDYPLTPGIVGISFKNTNEMGQNIFTYDTIFDDNFNLFNFDNFNGEISKRIKEAASSAYLKLQLKGPVRIDFRITKSGKYYMVDYNNSPHLGIKHSFAFALEQLGFNYVDMLKLIIYPALS